jgi:hypothetical protein
VAYDAGVGERPSGSAAARAATVVSLLIVGACVAVRVRAVIAHGPTDFDDAYMFLRYARNVLAGHGVAWNADEPPVQGVTSLLHLGVVTLLCAIWPANVDQGRLLQAASCTAGLAAVALMAVTCARFTPGRREDRTGPEAVGSARSARARLAPWAAALFLLVTTGEAFAFHARSGMDTMLALLGTAAVAGAALWLAERPDPRRAVVAAVIGYVAFLARPENGVAAAVCPTLALLLLAPEPRAARRPLLLFAAAFAGLLIIDLVARKLVFGGVLPLPFLAKRAGSYQDFAGEYTWNPFWFLMVFVTAATPFLLVLLALVGRGRWRVAAALLAPVLPVIGFLISVKQIMGHLGRFYFPLLSLVVVAAGVTLGRAWERHKELRRGLMWRVPAAVLALVAAQPVLESAGRRYAERQGEVPVAAESRSALPEIDSWQASRFVGELARAAPEGTVMAMSEHGLVGAMAPGVKIVDVLGLHDPVFAREGFSAAELWRRRPDVVWMPHPDHAGMLRAIVESEELRRHYDYWPEAFFYGVALRRQGPRAAGVRAAFERQWRAAYPGARVEDHRLRR